MAGSHDYLGAERNQDILIDINGDLFPRAEAQVSVFDSGFVLGDGVWEGLRVCQGTVLFLERHLDRLYEGMHTLDFSIDVDSDALRGRIYRVIEANGMEDDVHIRLMVTRGVKSTPYQDPRVTITPPTIVIIPEYKQPHPDMAHRGLSLFTVHVRRGYSDVQDPTLNTHSKLNCITACIQAAKAGADEALMLDPHGFVATCNSTHFFIVRRGDLWTSTGNYCLDGITRRKVLEIARELGLEVQERNFTLTDVYNAQEAFVTGTFAGLSPVSHVDGRQIGDGEIGPVLKQLQNAYLQAQRDYVSGVGRGHSSARGVPSA
ncbi:MAG: aminotransferase class IV [Pseudomonadota bacterium]